MNLLPRPPGPKRYTGTGTGSSPFRPPDGLSEEHIQGTPWWTRYQPVTYNLTSRSGDEQAFAQMVQRCRGAGVKIYVGCGVEPLRSHLTRRKEVRS